MRNILLALACLLTTACVSMNPGLGAGPPCQVDSDGQLLLRGHTAAPMLACVDGLANTPVTRIILDSTGGPVVFALQIGDRLARYDVEMVVRGQCNSSCANYFLPVARTITVEPGSMVLLHGSADAGLLAQSSAAPGANVDKLREQFDAQAAFAERHHIHSGWLQIRDEEDVAAKRGSKFTSGMVKGPFSSGKLNVKAMLVEEAFMRSCLGGVEITPFSETVAQRVYTEENLAVMLAKQGIYPTGDMACIQQITAPASNVDTPH